MSYKSVQLQVGEGFVEDAEGFVGVQGFSGSTRRMFPNRWAGSLGEKALCHQETREM